MSKEAGMEDFLNGLLNLLEYIDAHDGIVAMIGIAVTVLIFRREVVNNFYTLEKENFNEVFRPAYNEIPKKIKQLENAGLEKWDDCFDELLGEFAKMLDGANYFRYTMPYLYKLLETYIGEIEDLSRHDNWRIYRCTEKQLQLITKKSRKIIKAIDNSSKGRVFAIKIQGSLLIKKIKSIFVSCLVDRPYDRISSYIIKSSCQGAVVFNNSQGETYSKDVLDRLKWGHIKICPKTDYKVVRVIPIQTASVICFGYLLNLRLGNVIGKICLKTPRDKRVKVHSLHHAVKIDLIDNWPHKIVVMWQKMDDNNHMYYDIIKIRQFIE